MPVEPQPKTSSGGALAALVCAALAVASIAPASPAHADDATDPTSALVGDFSLGDGIEAMIDERDGSLSFALPVAGLRLGWSSRAAGDDPAGLGAGWGFDLGHVEVDGGVRVQAASGRVYELDRSHQSGLAGYGSHDLLFEAAEGRLPPREAAAEPVAYRFVLHELGGRSTYFDERGNPVRRIDRTGPDDTSTTTTAYRYDAVGRLTGSSVHAGTGASAPVQQSTEYELSVGGDIVRETVTARAGRTDQTVSTREFSYSALGELLAVTTGGVRREQHYDEAGNLVLGADGTSHTYDAANRPISTTTGAHTTTIDYWPDGTRRSRSTVDAATGAETRVEYFWDEGALLSEVHTARGVAEPGGEAGYLIGLSRHARAVRAEVGAGAGAGAGAAAYYTADRHGSITELTDRSGDVIERYGYSDYGAQTRATDGSEPDYSHPLSRNPFGFAGELTDPDGTQALGQRRYHPATMRFGSADTADVVSPYAYAGLNPVTKADPTGHMPEWDAVINGVLAGVGAIVLGFTVATLAAAVPMLGAPATLWTAYGFGWAAALGDLFTTAVAVVQVADDFSPRDRRFISESDSEILTWSSLGVGLATFATGLAASAFLRETARDAGEMLLELNSQNATRHFGLNHSHGTFDERWAVGRTVYVELKWVEKPFGYVQPKRRSVAPPEPAQPSLEQKRATLSPEECSTKCDTIIESLTHAGARNAATHAVMRFRQLVATPKLPRGASESVFSNLIQAAKGMPSLTPTDLNALDDLRTTALTLE